MLATLVDVEMQGAAVGALDGLRRQIDRQRRVGAAFRILEQLLQILRRDNDREDAVLGAVC
ncbi:hypothetical protein M2440_001282 [Methylorubrum extorquens]|nr:hypothetical protein [Methylorubrum extorquens]